MVFRLTRLLFETQKFALIHVIIGVQDLSLDGLAVTGKSKSAYNVSDITTGGNTSLVVPR